VNGETAVTGNGEFNDVLRETFDVVGRTAGPVAEYRLNVTYDDHPDETSWLLQSRTTGSVVAASGFNEVVEAGLSLSQAVDLVPGDEYELVVLDLAGDGMCCLFGEGSIDLVLVIDGIDIPLVKQWSVWYQSDECGHSARLFHSFSDVYEEEQEAKEGLRLDMDYC
jgi:hypothetical protein